MDIEPTVFLSPADVEVVCVAPKKKPRAPSHIWTDEETGVFLSLMQGDETTLRYFNANEAEKMPRSKAMKKISGLIRAQGFGVTAVK